MKMPGMQPTPCQMSLPTKSDKCSERVHGSYTQDSGMKVQQSGHTPEAAPIPKVQSISTNTTNVHNTSVPACKAYP